ncbi:fimbrial protein [Providencia alcalifaciens]|uniref:fimbrial protein n=2 Tax=Providencia alcalifaciens TaxID=126385 RepID=UPI001CC7AA2E
MMTPYFKKVVPIILCCFSFLSVNAFGAVSNCQPGYGDFIQENITFDITSSSTSIASGTTLGTASSSFMSLKCDFTGSVATPNHVYFKNALAAETKTLLLNSGVTVTQRSAIGGGTTATVTNASVPNLDLGYWEQPAVGTSLNIGIMYNFAAIKGTNALKPFDTGNVLLGYHVDYQGKYLGALVYIRIVGNLTLLCPTPAVSVTASNGGSVNFGTISPKQMNAGEVVSRPFNIGMAVPQDCETGLNVSVRFEPNNNTVLGNKYLDMGNGLQTVIKSNATELNFNQNYAIGEIKPQSPVNVPYTATLSKISGQTITSGPFSKTIRVVVSY